MKLSGKERLTAKGSNKIAGVQRQIARAKAGLLPGIGRAIFNTLLPVRCHACGRVIAPVSADCKAGGSEAILRACLCDACVGTFLAIESPLCPRCGKMFVSRQGPDHLCSHCSRHRWHFESARSAGVFDHCLAALVYRFKYSGRTGLAKPLGLIMRAVLHDTWTPDDIDCVVPVPLHRKRLRERGFNQSHLLARSLAASQAAGPEALHVDADVLRRIRPTASQTGLGRKDREANLKNAFAVNPGKSVAGLRLLVVDDVFTTGATVNECARGLLNAGAGRVDILTLARTQTEYGKPHHGQIS